MDKTLGSAGNQTFPALDTNFWDLLQQSDMLNILPVAAYVCDMDGFIKSYNGEAIRLWGKKPVTGPDGARYDGPCKVYRDNGEYIPHDQTSAAACLIYGIPSKDLDIIIERPDNSRIHVR